MKKFAREGQGGLVLAFVFVFISLGSLFGTGSSHAQGQGQGQWQGQPPALEAFFQNPAFTRAQISPDGKHVALGVQGKNGRIALVVMDTDNPASAKVVGGFSNSDVWRFMWLSDNRLAYNIDDLSASQAEVKYGAGLFAVDRDGGEPRQLAELDYRMERRLGDREFLDTNARLFGATADRNSDDVFVLLPEYSDNLRRDFESFRIARVNTKTRAVTRFSRPGNTIAWVVDAKDIPRASVTHDKSTAATHYLDPASGKWVKLEKFDAYRGSGMEPVAVTPDGALYVTADTPAGTRGLYRYDFDKKAPEAQPLVSIPGYDFDGHFIMDSRRVLGLRYVSDAESTVWFDQKLKALQAKVDALLPGTINRIDVPIRGDSPFVLVTAFSDADPGSFLLFDARSGKFTLLGKKMPGIEPRQMGSRELVRYKARDGLTIPAWLTLPRGGKGKKLPMVVLVHGGPWVPAARWKWDADSQFLASRGYAVLEPEFRGTLGYGSKHFGASWKQWGLAMQDDIADGTRWAVAQGIADPGRICIAGASYGGYATLMGLIRDPDLYKCGVEWVGVTDIELLHTANWSNMSEVYKTYGLPSLVADREKDAAQIEATSPLRQAAKIRQPLLMAYGGNDRRVPIVHGTQFLAAVQKTNTSVEWIEYPDEGHGWALVKTRVDFWSRVERFLARHIGSQPQ